jgi:hypothetical protein
MRWVQMLNNAKDQSGGPEKKSEKSSGDKDKKHDFMHDLEDKIQHPSQLLHHSSQ